MSTISPSTSSAASSASSSEKIARTSPSSSLSRSASSVATDGHFEQQLADALAGPVADRPTGPPASRQLGQHGIADLDRRSSESGLRIGSERRTEERPDQTEATGKPVDHAMNRSNDATPSRSKRAKRDDTAGIDQHDDMASAAGQANRNGHHEDMASVTGLAHRADQAGHDDAGADAGNGNGAGNPDDDATDGSTIGAVTSAAPPSTPPTGDTPATDVLPVADATAPDVVPATVVPAMVVSATEGAATEGAATVVSAMVVSATEGAASEGAATVVPATEGSATGGSADFVSATEGSVTVVPVADLLSAADGVPTDVVPDAALPAVEAPAARESAVSTTAGPVEIADRTTVAGAAMTPAADSPADNVQVAAGPVGATTTPTTMPRPASPASPASPTTTMPATTMLAATSQAAPAGATADTPTPDVASAMAALSGVAVTNAESVAGSGARRTSTAQPSGDLTPAGTTPAGTTPAVAALVDALAAAGRAGTQSGSNQREGSTGRQVPGGTAMMATAGVSTTAALGSTVSTLAISVGTNSDTAKAGSATASMQAPAPGTHRPPLGLVDTRRLAIDLGDEGLGPLRLQALTQGGTLHMSLSAADPLVREALVRNSFELRRDLESAGVNLGSLDVGNFDRGHQGGTASQRDGDAASMRSSGEPTRPGGDGGRPARSDSSRSLRGSSTASNSLDLMI